MVTVRVTVRVTVLVTAIDVIGSSYHPDRIETLE